MEGLIGSTPPHKLVAVSHLSDVSIRSTKLLMRKVKVAKINDRLSRSSARELIRMFNRKLQLLPVRPGAEHSRVLLTLGQRDSSRRHPPGKSDLEGE